MAKMEAGFRIKLILACSLKVQQQPSNSLGMLAVSFSLSLPLARMTGANGVVRELRARLVREMDERDEDAALLNSRLYERDRKEADWCVHRRLSTFRKYAPLLNAACAYLSFRGKVHAPG